MPALLSRRALLGLALTGAAATVCIGTSRAAPFVNRTGLRPGSFVWQPGLARSGPLLVVAALREQTVHVYRAGVEIGISTCTSGWGGLRSPTGLFLAERQEKDATSSSGERLVWTGGALHAARFAGYPAERGCVRLPDEFADLLFEAAGPGVAVLIAEERSNVRAIELPCALIQDASGAEAGHLAGRCGLLRPGQEPVSLIVSGADARAYVMHGTRVTGTVAIGRRQAAAMRGTHVYALVGRAARSSALRWLAFATAETRSAQHLVRFDPETPLRGLALADRDAAARIAEALQPGSTILLTEASAAKGRRAEAGFAIMANSVPTRPPATAQVSLRRQAPAKPAAARERVTSASPLHDLFRPY